MTGIFDDIAKTFVLDTETRAFFDENNPWALEEIARRLLEAEARHLWKADPDVLAELREAYMDIEGTLEDRTEAFGGEFQGGFHRHRHVRRCGGMETGAGSRARKQSVRSKEKL